MNNELSHILVTDSDNDVHVVPINLIHVYSRNISFTKEQIEKQKNNLWKKRILFMVNMKVFQMNSL